MDRTVGAGGEDTVMPGFVANAKKRRVDARAFILYPLYLVTCLLANWEVMRPREFARADLDQWAILRWAQRYHMGSYRPKLPLEPYYQRQFRANSR